MRYRLECVHARRWQVYLLLFCCAQQTESSLCRDTILARKRAEYRDMVPQWFDIAGSTDDEAGALRQVSKALPSAVM